MNAHAHPNSKPDNARAKLLQAALVIIRAKGYSATSVDELCVAAGVTKGAFFHHFVSKESLAVAAADYWSQTTAELFATAPYHRHADPLDRVMGYIDFRADLLEGPVEAFTCLVGTMVQEAFSASPAIRAACKASIFGHARTLESDIDEAMELYGVRGTTARSLALHTQAVLQGAFVLAKAEGGPAVAADSVAHLKCYFDLLFNEFGAANEESNARRGHPQGAKFALAGPKKARPGMSSSKIAPCLWFDGQAEEAANLYVSLFPDAAIGAVSRYGPEAPFAEGTALVVEFTLAGQRFQAINGGPRYQLTEAISLSVSCKDAAEVDRYWNGLIEGGGEDGRCGWLKDRFGVSWQVVPDGLGVLLSDPDPGRARRATQSMMTLKKLDLAAMRMAADGDPT